MKDCARWLVVTSRRPVLISALISHVRTTRMKRKEEATANTLKVVYLTLGNKSYPLSSDGEDDDTIEMAVQRVIEETGKKELRKERAGFYILKKVATSTKISDLHEQFEAGYSIYAPASTIPLEGDQEETTSDKRRRGEKGEVIKIQTMIVGNGKGNEQFSYSGIKHALDKVLTINQVFGNGIAQNNGESITIHDWIDKKISSDDQVSRESFLKEFELKIQELNPEEQQKFRDIFNDVLYYQSSKDTGFILEEYVMRMCYFF